MACKEGHYIRARGQSASQWVGQWTRGRKLASLAGWPARLESNTHTHYTFARHTSLQNRIRRGHEDEIITTD